MLNEWLWQEKFWLPPGTSWQDLEMKEDEGRFPLPRDLIYTLPLAFAFIALRYVFERWDTPASVTAGPWNHKSLLSLTVTSSVRFGNTYGRPTTMILNDVHAIDECVKQRVKHDGDFSVARWKKVFKHTVFHLNWSCWLAGLLPAKLPLWRRIMALYSSVVLPVDGGYRSDTQREAGIMSRQFF